MLTDCIVSVSAHSQILVHKLTSNALNDDGFLNDGSSRDQADGQRRDQASLFPLNVDRLANLNHRLLGRVHELTRHQRSTSDQSRTSF